MQQDLLAYVHDFKRLLQQYAAAVTLLDEQKREIHDIDQALDPYASSADPNVRALVTKVDELNTELQKVNVNQTLQFDCTYGSILPRQAIVGGQRVSGDAHADLCAVVVAQTML